MTSILVCLSSLAETCSLASMAQTPAESRGPTTRTKLYSTIALLAIALAGCGGGGGGSAPPSSSSSGASSSGTANVVSMIINSGPAALASQGGTYNTPFISVTLCQPGSTTCATIPYIAVDTGSAGLRVFASVLTSAGLNLPVMNDPNNPANTVAECLPFLDGYAWGPIVTAALTVGGESVSSLSVQ